MAVKKVKAISGRATVAVGFRKDELCENHPKWNISRC